ncbi:MAG: PepSY domain-containing protein [Gammaproteobacteria bacterium]|nr:PepSY domain-containing protein [Gammaproteobacteria bacterium]
MKRASILLITLALTGGAGTTLASESRDCGNEPRSSWADEAKVEAKLTDMGYEVRRVKVEDGCYEAYATKDGKRFEIYLHPVSLEVVRSKQDD